MKITTVGIDLAKSVFQVHGIDVDGKIGAQKATQAATFFVNPSPYLIGMEA